MAASVEGAPVVDKAVIVGGGIGGLAAAIALHKLGIATTVYERALAEDRSKVRGTVISLYENGLQALHAIDPSIPTKLRDRSSTLLRVQVMSETGEVLKERNDFVPSSRILLRWSTIVDTLADALPPSCIQTGYTCTGIDEVDGELAVSVVKDGVTTVVKAPLVIGADGVRSRVRDYVMNDTPVEMEDMGRQVWRAIIPFNSFTHSVPGKAFQISNGEGGRGVIVTLGSEWLFWSVTAVDDLAGDERSTSSDVAKRRAKQCFPEWKDLQAAMEATRAEDILERRILTVPDLPTWNRGPVALLGDSAHATAPTAGQGANLALEDALELARQLLASSSLDEALTNFVAERRQRVRVINELGIHFTDPEKNKIVVDYPRLVEPLIKMDAACN